MDSLDLATHQLILDSLALNLAQDACKGNLSQQDSAFFRNSAASTSKVKGDQAYLSAAAVRTHIGLALFASSISSASSSTNHTVDVGADQHLSPVLDDLLFFFKKVPSMNIESGMDWSDWPLADQLAFSMTVSLLRIASNAPQHRNRCIEGILNFAEILSQSIDSKSGDAHVLATRLLPLFHGLYRAVASVVFPWNMAEFSRLAVAIIPLAGPASTTRRLNDVLLTLPEQTSARAQGQRATRRKPKKPTIRPAEEDDRSDGSVDTFFSGDEADEDDEEEQIQNPFVYLNGSDEPGNEDYEFRMSLLSHYRKVGRPLSGHFVLCGAVEILSSVLAQALAVHAKPPIKDFGDYQKAGLDQNKLDPAKQSQADLFDRPGSQKSSFKDSSKPSAEESTRATKEAWAALLRYSVNSFDGDLSEVSANGKPQARSGSRFLPSVLGGGGNSSAAFGEESGADNGEALGSALHAASRAYHDLQRFIENEGNKRGELFVDVYALEILSEALKLGSLCSVAQARISGGPVDSHVMVRIRSLLSDQAIVHEPVVQGSALQCVGVLVQNFPAVALPMTTQLRRFVTSPLPMFEVPVNSQDSRSPTVSPILASAAKCLATCVTIAPGDDLLVSTMYTLLNYLGKDASTGGFAAGGAAGGAVSVRSGAGGTSRGVLGRDYLGVGHSASQGSFATRNDEQKRLINMSTIGIVSRLALEVGKPEVTALTISMLLQRLRTSDATAERAILNNLVPLALAAPKSAYIDVVRAFTNLSRNSIADSAERKNGGASSVQQAQLRLARGLGRLNEKDDRDEGTTNGTKSQDANRESEDAAHTGGRKEVFLVELLQLFAEKGIQLQTTTAASRGSKEELSELTSDLADLLPVIASLLSHDDINPQLSPTLEMVSLFRNMWFLSVLFGFATPQNVTRSQQQSNTSSNRLETQTISAGKALSRISLKTPTLVPESAHNYLESDLEYNSVLKREFSQVTLDQQRKTLASVIPSHASDVRSFSFAQVTFLTTIYDLECARSSMGRPSMTLWYFVNEGLNNSALVGAMEAIADKVLASFIQDIATQVNDHSLDPRVSAEVKNLLLGSCHRVEKVRQISRSFLDKLIGNYPSLLCDPDLVITMLEMLTLLRQACEGEFKDEYSPVYHFHSEKADVAFDLSDSYPQRGEILSQFLQRTRSYLTSLMSRAPVELQGILQRYLSTFDDGHLPRSTELGKSVAVDFARTLPPSVRTEGFLPNLGGWKADTSSSFVGELSAKSTYLGEMTGIHLALTNDLVELQKDPSRSFGEENVKNYKKQLANISKSLNDPNGHKHLPFSELRRLLYRAAALAVALKKPDFELLHYIVSIPIRLFTPAAVSTASNVWTWIIGERPEVETKIMVEISIGFAGTIRARQGIFSKVLNAKHPLLEKTEMSAFDRAEVERENALATRLFSPHLTLIHLISSRYQAFRYRDPTMVLALVRLIQRSGAATSLISSHPLAREARFSLIVFGFRLIQGSRLDGLVEFQLRDALYRMAFAWFAGRPEWSFGSNRLQVRAEMQLFSELLDVLRADQLRASFVITSFPPAIASVRLPGQLSVSEAIRTFSDRRTLLQLLVESELSRFAVWANPLADASRGADFNGELSKTMTEASWPKIAQLAWRVNPSVAIQMVQRFKSAALKSEVARLVRAQPHKAVDSDAALEHLLEDHLKLSLRDGTDLRWLLYWAPVTPVEAIHLFQPEYDNHPMVLQYAMRTLEQHPVALTFFYVPQVVQALRDDAYGYVEQFIFETSKISQLFCHQILWNMKANCYKDDSGEVEDPMKPTLDRMVELIVQALSGEAQNFYDREFGFFDEVTSISGKLKPYIKKSKQEKKAKIDEEMAKIKVDAGVYLPSNPDGVVVDIDRKSGRPLQSHAKAPFMATFKVHRDVPKKKIGNGSDTEVDSDDETAVEAVVGADSTGVDVWQAAIFKVGDDCRQDVLALQVIAMFKNIFTTVGLDLYLNPYRVTATGPGCGVIDVVPNATSRDEMGRAKINNLLAFFIGKYGNVDGIAFQKARLNFIQSMAAYSIACYILQIKDRHNGNIMIDADGHIIHIDFGFLFDIGPGGMKFEPNSFKLSHEMVEVMGGADSQGFRIFSELVTKAFLACRPYAEQIIEVCSLMIGTDLPSFKGTPTIDRLRDRFKLEMTERQAAKHAQYLIKDGFENPRSTFYDGFQKLQNGIPY